MWPTFYIPFPLIGEEANAGIDYMCGVVTATGTPGTVTIPTPASYSSGDIQVVFITTTTNSSINFPTSLTSEWFEVYGSYRFPYVNPNNYPNANQRIFMRSWASGQSAWNASLSGGGFQTHSYVSMVLNNPNPTDRFLSGTMYWSGAAVASFSAPKGDSSYFSGARPGDALLFSISYGAGGNTLTPPNAADVEFVCQNVPEHTVAGAYTKKGVSNLLLHSRTLSTAAWTDTGLVRTTNVTWGSSKFDTQLSLASGSSRHYTEQSVTLEAGKTYCLGIAGLGYGPAPNAVATHLTYVKPDNTEHGVGVAAGQITDRVNVAGSEIVWGSNPGPGHIADNNTSISRSGHLMYVPIICTASGTYKIRLNLTCQTLPIPDPTTATSGNTSGWWSHTDIVLQESNITNQVPSFCPTTGSAILPGQSPYDLIPFPNYNPSISDSSKGFSAIVMRRATSIQKRPACYAFGSGIGGRNYSWNSTMTGLNSTYGQYVHDPGYASLQSNHAIYRQLTNQKFYYELTVTDFGTGGTNDDYFIGFAPFEAGANSHYHYATQPYKYVYQYGYSSTGKVYSSGTLVGSGYTAWSAGDKIGASIDFANWEIKFYRNGTLIETVSIANDARRDALWVGIFQFTGPNVYSYESHITVNFKGSFSGRKPSGFVALDFDNEVP